MDEAIADLILAPFRDIVSQGNVALRNAVEGGNDGMVKAAQHLVKEGDRALKKIEPLCLKKYDESGPAFVNALKDNEEISQFIEALNNLLYDFEEYGEVDNFEAEKFAELQSLSRKAVPRISHIITRMKLEPESISSPPVAEPTISIRQPSDDSVPQRREPLPYPEETEPEVKYASMPYPTDLNQDFEYRLVDLPPVVQLPSVREEESPPPPPPLLDPWSNGSHSFGEGLDQRREAVASPDSAIGSEHNSDYNSSPVMTGHSKYTQPLIPPRDPNRINTTATLGHSLEQTTAWARYRGRDSISPISPRMNPRDSIASSANTSIRSSVSSQRRDRERDSYCEVASPVSPVARAPTYASDFQTQNQGPSPHVPPLFAPRGGSTSLSLVGDGLEPVVLPMPSVPDGLIPVEEEQMAEPVSPLPDPESQLGGCAIKSSSSFHHFKGFCAGAIEVIQGGLGIKHIKKQGLATGQIEVAKCKACDFELEWKAVERDVNNEATENFKSAGIDFRLRFLSKSHIYTKNVGEQVYGCLFCLQLRRTSHPNDATVFFSQRQLFAHLARHPQPLPHVPGLKVVQAQEVPVADANNYDLHFSRPPRQSHLADSTRELTALPTATALQTCRPTPTFAMRRPPDGAEVVAFAAGARIVGIEFPEKYQGEWCFGWADHECGLLPTDAIRLDAPRRNDVRSRGSSTMKAVARWKFSVKETKDKGCGGGGDGVGEWLTFSKGEVIINIGWSHQDHWCWWGTNSKGKSGMFPRSHVEPGTLMEAATKSDRASITSNDRKTGLLSRISIRHRSSGSGGGGGGGGEGNTSPRASIY